MWFLFCISIHIATTHKNNHTCNKFCCQCNFQTTSDEKLEEHIKLLHNPMDYSSDSNTSIIPQKRPIIHNSLTETSIWREDTEIGFNMKTKYDNASKQSKPMSEFYCEICHKSFSSRFNFQRHVKNVHGK